MKKEVGEEEGMAQAAPQRESVAGSFALRLLSLAGGNLRGGLRGPFRIFINCPGVPLQGHGLL